MNEALYVALDASGAEMPFTTYDVNVKLGAQEIDRISGTQQDVAVTHLNQANDRTAAWH